jgi:6-phosphogluconolactonase
MEGMKLAPCFGISLLVLLAMFAGVFSTESHAATSQGKYLVYVGTYTQRGSQGIYAFSYDAASGSLTPLGLAAESSNPSFLAVHPNHKFLYAVNENTSYQGQKSGAISAYSIDPVSGKLTLLNEVASRGADPCHISLDHTGKFVLVANYTGGNLAVFPVGGDGKLGQASEFIQHNGTGPNKERQEAPHAHWIDLSHDNHFVLNADLGLDQVFIYHFDAAKGTLKDNNPPSAKVAPGAGPRHVAFSPNGKFVYVINELNSTLTTFSFDPKKGTATELQAVSTLPKDFNGQNDTAEVKVHPSGKFVYGSNRGHNSIAVFAVDAKKGTLTLVESASTTGKTPRNFEIDPTGTRLFVANQESDNVIVFAIDPNTGKLTPTGTEVKVAVPASIQFVPVK